MQWREVLEPGQAVTVEVPASSGNVGPGFDSLGLALGHYDTVRLEILESGLEFDLNGEGCESVPRTEDHLLLRSVRAAWTAAGLTEQPGLRVHTRNRIPHGRGMGSSATCVVAGVVAANALLPAAVQLTDTELLQVCAGLEGHPDNVAPSLYGGLTISWGEPGHWHSAPVAVHPDVVPVVAIPNYEVSTALARSLLPAEVEHRTAAVNAGRAALLVEALTRRPELLLPATHDGLHQPFRAPAMPPSVALVAHLRAQGHAALISGAGPTVLTLAPSAEAAEQAEADIMRFTAHPEPDREHVTWRVLRLVVPARGAKVETHPKVEV
ncbi:homoserine kinase [Kocuria sp.]|uniref:homoserine kinase n=1 Tax=Kocuria sp. TaxID=1871328 RepID=UPI0026DFB917|nr:homoserine kinase [Kocuria sp.]MDO5618389.1 homoserine kinase [Kocuria sp.]